MRVTHVITRLIVGGAQENTISTVLGLNRKGGITADLISGPTTGPEGSLESIFDNHPGTLRVLPELVRPVSPLSDLRALLSMTRIFRAERPDIVHTHSGKAGIIGRFAAARARVPIIIHTIHGPSFGPWQGPAANLLFGAAERAAGKFTTHFVAVANAMIDQYLGAGISKKERYSRIFSGFDLKPFLQASNDLALRKRLGIAPADLVVGKIARLFRLKGHEDLFAAAPAILRAHPNTKFLLVGGGEWEGQFRSMAKRMGLQDSFIFTGLVPPGEIPSMVGIMDLLVHLSRREGLPRALPQALAAGKPVIAYDCDGAGEVCISERTGFLVQPGDVSQLTQRVNLLLGDAPLRLKLGTAGQKFVKQNFDVKKMVDQIYDLYQFLAQQNRSAAKA
jgi:glycosyltransferase involved in cell wall biosynthesis